LHKEGANFWKLRKMKIDFQDDQKEKARRINGECECIPTGEENKEINPSSSGVQPSEEKNRRA
jgi:hypothetical protein